MNNMIKVLLIPFLCFIFYPHPVFTQDRNIKKDDSLKLESIKVTATKQEENVQSISQSISVFTESGIEDRNIDSLSDVADSVPNFMLINNGASGMNSPSIRGVHIAPYAFSSTVGLFVDGIPVTSGMGFENLMVDVERVEVLRGPQGTLYGKNTEIGAINIVSKKPDNDFRGKVTIKKGKLLSAETGDKNRGSIAFNASGPIKKDKLFLGVTGKFYQRDGYIENTARNDTEDDKEHWFGKGYFLFSPSDRLNLTFIGSRLQYDDDSSNMSLAKDGAALFGLSNPQDRKVASNYQGLNGARSDSQVMKVEFEINENLNFTSITSKREYIDESRSDWDFTQKEIMHSAKDSVYSKASHEMRVDYSKDKLKWLVGFYYDRDENDFNFKSMSSKGVKRTDRIIEGDSFAWFANLTTPLSSRFNLVSGIRWEKQYFDFEDKVDKREANESWDSISPRIGLEFIPHKNCLTYLTIAKGYRSGGFNLAAKDQDYDIYDDESLWSYEAGVKSVFFNDRLIINTAVYYLEIDDMQVEEAVDHMNTYITNAARAKGKGLEAEINTRITKNLSLFGSVGYNNLEFDKFKDAKGNYKNNKNPYAPDYTFNLGGQFRHDSGLFARADLRGYGKMYLDKENIYSRGAYEIVNVKLGYETETFDIYAYGENIFDEEYNLEGYFGGMYTIYSDPGEYGIKISYRF